MNYQEALSYIQNVRTDFCVPGTERVAELCRRLGDPQKKLSVIHVTGTNGKGSVCVMLSEILRAAGYRVGLYTSPQMLSFRERIRVDGLDIPEEDVVLLIERICLEIDKMDQKPTEFELVTAMAFAYFFERQCDFVVLETGLGGSLDATNVIEEPLVSVITGVGMDHTAYLGDTLKQIAAHKAGIIKADRPVVLGECDGEIFEIFKQKAATGSSDIYRVDPSQIAVHRESLNGTCLSYKEFSCMELSLLGSYQSKNCATVLECLHALSDQGYAVSEQAIRTGLSHVVWHGRFEVVCREPLVIYDGGHNLDGTHAFLDSLTAVLPAQKVCLVCGILKDKEYQKMVKLLSPVVYKVFTVTVNSPRALPAGDLAEAFTENGAEAVAGTAVKETLEEALLFARTHQIPLVINGSLYMYSEVMQYFSNIL